ncbi:NAD(P)H-binding protein (plasmid) [Ralstonia solanacearum]|uniref:NAD(P)H-binding protein n=1 Tax=Ralstonia solanacearum TaxID=305 RepID=A0AAE3T3T9_RALSL|nr:NAD(P)H-binding protein [Ralstonia solanacearum]MBB6583565.1 NAD(P)H-binding protein [Ralstonia solanacearum]MDB0520514.1 NAD(P)H-binding protein [Ralstonia solanacearum]QHB56483.1 NAD(P)H-binding protein [Ralstonia solanacearum]
MYVVIGANGQVGRKVVEQLSRRGAAVRAIVQRVEAGQALPHVEARVGDATDVAFLREALSGADALFTLTPPSFSAPSHARAVDRFGSAVLAAIAASDVRKVVNLSSAGATLPQGTGPIAGLYRNEQRLNSLATVDVLHLRAASFMENLLAKIGPMRQAGVFPDMADGDVPMPMVAAADLAQAAADALLAPTFTGKSAAVLLGDRDYTMREATAILGAAVGRPDIAYVRAAPADAKAALIAHGFSPDVADQFEEMADALSRRRIQDTVTRTAASTTATSLQAWAREVFAPAFQSA